MYTLPQLQGTLYTMDDSVVIVIVSLTLVRCDLSVLPDFRVSDIHLRDTFLVHFLKDIH